MCKLQRVAPTYKLERVRGQPVPDSALLDDLRRVAALAQTDTVSLKLYREKGDYDGTTVARRFGTWNDALKKAGLAISNEISVADDRLFENLLVLWKHYGRQPRRAELAFSPSTISQSPYLRRFRTWTGALNSFVTYANSQDQDDLPSPGNKTTPTREAVTGRDPSLRLRFRVLQRDSFRCVQCGANPATSPGVRLHIDHIVAWSKGGKTSAENLQTLCEACNLGKGAV